MSKYQFKELKKRPKNVALPSDCNEVAFSIAEKLKDEELKTAIREAQEKRWFGTLYNFDNESNVRVSFEFCSGICIKAKPIKRMGKSCEFHMNVLNNKVSLKKGDEDELRNEEGQRLEGEVISGGEIPPKEKQFYGNGYVNGMMLLTNNKLTPEGDK